MAAQPGVEVFRSLEVEQGIGQGFEIAQWQALDAGLLSRAEGAAAALQLAQGEGGGFGLAALLTPFLAAFLAAQPKDLAVGHAACEVVDGDPIPGADLGNGAASWWCRPGPSAGWLF